MELEDSDLAVADVVVVDGEAHRGRQVGERRGRGRLVRVRVRVRVGQVGERRGGGRLVRVRVRVGES